MARSTTWVIAVIAAVPAVAASPSFADEAYICEGGRIQYVKPDDLPGKKLTDPCIAGYYGLLPMPPANLKALNEVKAAPAPAAPAAVVERAVASIQKPIAKSAKPAAPVLKKLQERLQPEHDGVSRTASIAAPTADFRNVHVLNAVTGENQWFRHGQ